LKPFKTVFSPVLACAWILLAGLSAQASDEEWRYWQEQFHRLQADREPDPAKKLEWSGQPLGVKEIEVTAVIPGSPPVPVSRFRGFDKERCPTCHDGIEISSLSHPREFGCTVCHGGDGNALDRETAHASLIYDPEAGTGKRNPSSLQVADQSCGLAGCHAGHADESRNHIERVRKSLMGTLAGVIAGLRYQWSGQYGKTALYGIHGVVDRDGDVPLDRGALPALKPLPFFAPAQRPDSPASSTEEAHEVSGHVGDLLLRTQCLQCHLDRTDRSGNISSEGCAACHFAPASGEASEGRDPTLRSDSGKGRRSHRLAALPGIGLCSQCHRSYALTADSGRGGEGRLDNGSPMPDIHFARGMECIDCHTQSDIMGDGNIYSKQFQATEVRCQTCHGDSGSPPLFDPITGPEDPVLRLSRHYRGWTNSTGDRMALTARNRKMANVKLENEAVVAYGKRTGLKWVVPLAQKVKGPHSIPQHREKLECTACHSRWVPRCEGCHTSIDLGSAQRGNASARPGGRTFVQYLSPALMIGPRGKVVPMLPQPPRTLTVLDASGNPVPALDDSGNVLGYYRDWEFSNPHGDSGSNLSYATQPHSVTREVRPCSGCHLAPQTLGLGEGDLDIGAAPTGKLDAMDYLNRTDRVTQKLDLGGEAKVTLRGEAISGSSQPGARPFNQGEINRILKVGNCLPCHDRYEDPIYRDIDKSYKFEKNLKHRKLRDKILNP